LYKLIQLIKLFIPPIIFILFKRKIFKKQDIQFIKTNLSWDEAYIQTSKGYSSNNIIKKCRDSLLKVKNGEYPYERDSVLFDDLQIFYPLLSSLFYISLLNMKKLNIIDYGGSLGSTYYQNKNILRDAGIAINWNIIEQENFVICGKEIFENNELHFYNNICEVLEANNNISVYLLSSFLPYIREPYKILDEIKSKDIEYLIIDRTVFLQNETKDILTIQNVPSAIYSVSYPAWFLSLDAFLLYINEYYDIIYKWQALDQNYLKNYNTIGLGFLLKKKKNVAIN